MRTLLLFLFLFPLVCKAQTDTVNNFLVENKEIVWQKVFPTNLSAGELFRQFKGNGLFINSNIDSLQMQGDLRQFYADYRGAGYSWKSTPIYLSDKLMNAFSIIEYKEGSYRVTVKRILLEQENGNNSRPGDKVAKMNLNDFALRGDKFNTGFKKSPNKTLDYTFTKLFTIADTSKSNL